MPLSAVLTEDRGEGGGTVCVNLNAYGLATVRAGGSRHVWLGQWGWGVGSDPSEGGQTLSQGHTVLNTGPNDPMSTDAQG